MLRNPFAAQDLPHLVQFIDPIHMQARFGSFLQPHYAVQRCEVGKVSFRPGKHCSALFRLGLQAQDGSDLEQWFFAKMYAAGKGRGRYEKERVKMGLGTDNEAPLSFWSDWETLVWAFPHDAKLPQLAQLVQGERVARLIEASPSVVGLTADSKLIDVQCARVKYVPGKRCVLRFEVEVEGAERPFQFYSKTFSNSQSRYVYDTLQTVRASLGTVAGHFEIPPLLAHFDDLHTFWQAEWLGASMAQLYRQANWPDALPAIARGLAAFHLSEIPNLRLAHYLDEIVSEVVGDAEWIADFVPSLGERVLGLVQRIERLELTILASQRQTAVPIHGAFRMSQLLYRPQDDLANGRLAMIDLDAIALGDPHYDVAEFMASTVYQYFHRDLHLEDLMAIAIRFSKLYAAQVPWPIDRRLLYWYMAASLVGKLRGSFKRIQFSAIAKTEDLFSLVSHYLEEVEAVATVESVI